MWLIPSLPRVDGWQQTVRCRFHPHLLMGEADRFALPCIGEPNLELHKIEIKSLGTLQLAMELFLACSRNHHAAEQMGSRELPKAVR